MAGRARGLWPQQDALQPVRSLVPHGTFDRIFANLAAENGLPDRVMIELGSGNAQSCLHSILDVMGRRRHDA